jgi:hypothetical protein
MTAPSLERGVGRDVTRIGTQADAHARPAALFFDEGGDLDPGDAAQAVDDPLGLLFAGAHGGEVGETQRGDQSAARCQGSMAATARAHRWSAASEPCSYNILYTAVTSAPSPTSHAAVSKVATEVLLWRK